MSNVPWWWALAVAVIVLLGWRQYQRQQHQDAVNAAAPLQYLAAEVSEVRASPRVRERSQERRGDPAMSWDMRFEATFHLAQENRALTLSLDETQYRALAVGMRGTLQLKGRRFIAFHPATGT